MSCWREAALCQEVAQTSSLQMEVKAVEGLGLLLNPELITLKATCDPNYLLFYGLYLLIKG